jgi:hypothetical protein
MKNICKQPLQILHCIQLLHCRGATYRLYYVNIHQYFSSDSLLIINILAFSIYIVLSEYNVDSVHICSNGFLDKRKIIDLQITKLMNLLCLHLGCGSII